jgi:uncharacterized membrane protein YfcA
MWQIYAAGAALTAIVTFRMVEYAGFSAEGITSWIAAMLIGGAIGGFVGSWLYRRWTRPRARRG